MSFSWVDLSPPHKISMIALPCLLVVDAITGTVCQAHLANAFADRLDVSGVTEAKSLHSRDDFRNGPLIRESGKPAVEFIGLLNLERMYPIGYTRHDVNNALSNGLSP